MTPLSSTDSLKWEAHQYDTMTTLITNFIYFDHRLYPEITNLFSPKVISIYIPETPTYWVQRNACIILKVFFVILLLQTIQTVMRFSFIRRLLGPYFSITLYCTVINRLKYLQHTYPLFSINFCFTVTGEIRIRSQVKKIY